MCGICGIAAVNGLAPEDGEAVAAMTRALRHRGPDRQDVAILPHCALGHARLSIIDLSDRAAQPMASADGRMRLAFNGEIYNFAELRRELEPHAWRSSSDTEVLLELLAARGTACLPRLNGMFALAAWDGRERRLLLARDRFGQKPLFYAVVGSRLIFASEVMALFRHPALERRPSLEAILHYLSAQSVPAPLSAFAGVRKLEPGHLLEWHDGEIRVTRWWNPLDVPPFAGSAEEAEEELDALLRAAAARHLVGDVPLGVFLSGGVDSSLVTALACRRRAEMRSFCVGFARPEHDERPFAARAAEICGSRHESAEAAPDIADLLPRMAFRYGEPFGDSSAPPTWLLCAMTRRHVTVALSGDGGDDLFCGYERHLNPFLFGRDAPPDVLRVHADLVREARLAGVPEDILPDPGMAKHYFHWARFRGDSLRGICSPELRGAAPAPTLRLALEHFARHARLHPLDRIRAFELDWYLASTLMTKTDIASMASSLEVRAPLLDAEVADFALSLPAEMRVRRLDGADAGSLGRGFEPKWILKRVACRYLPESLVMRRKMGFGAPVGEWLRGPLRPLLEDALLAPETETARWLDRGGIVRMLEEHMTGAANHQYRLWALLMLAMWERCCLKAPLPEDDVSGPDPAGIPGRSAA